MQDAVRVARRALNGFFHEASLYHRCDATQSGREESSLIQSSVTTCP